MHAEVMNNDTNNMKKTLNKKKIRNKQPRNNQDKKGRWVPYIFILPSFLIIVSFLFYPIGTVFYYSFQHYDISAPFYNSFAGLDNFIKIFTEDELFLPSLWTSLKWVVSQVGLQSIVGDAGDGEVALELVAKEQPAIIISDIRMPFMSGLEMAKQVNKKNPYTKIIFLTGYQDFKYAQEAVKLNAFDFLLKPIDSDLLLEKVKKAGDEWAAEIARERTIMKSLPLLQEKFLK